MRVQIHLPFQLAPGQREDDLCDITNKNCIHIYLYAWQLITYLPATIYNCPYSTKAEMRSVTFSLAELCHSSDRMTLVTSPALSWYLWFPSSLTLRIFPLQTAETGNGCFMWKRSLFEGHGKPRIQGSSRELMEEPITVAGVLTPARQSCPQGPRV